jgi:hypothetical protein
MTTTPSRLQAEIKNFRDLLVAKNLAIAANQITIRRVGTTQRVTWQSPIEGGQLLTSSEFATVQDYCQQLAANAFTVVLFDASIIQVSFDLRHNDIVGHRFCFFPCPFNVQPADLLGQPILDIIHLYEQAGLEYLRLRTPLRFEFDPNNTADEHPVCHVHLLWSHCRCSVVAPLSLGHFIKFIFQHFYPGIWQKHSFLREWPANLGSRTISAVQESMLHFTCRR